MSKILGTVIMSLDLALYLWPVTIAVLVAGFFGIRALHRLNKLNTWQSITALVSLIFPLLIVPAFTIVFWADHRVDTPESQAAPLNHLAIIWSVFAAMLIAAISFARGFRLALAGAASMVVWFAAGMYLISAMAVSGIWL
ncbi:MAG TPA: hypothetical protein VMF52_16265 [Steroidobacteraceae bacterium]|nr:hypothetical protein [Steroidobacteraceae bacterium]